jgi:hypothetical protein
MNNDSNGKSQSKKIKILIAEDERIADAFLTAALKKTDYTLFHVKTG